MPTRHDGNFWNRDVTALELTADENFALRINAVHLKYRLGDVETDYCNRLHVWLL